MQKGFSLFPEQASAYATRVDYLFFFLIAVAVFFAALISILVIAFVVRYHSAKKRGQATQIEGNITLEILWTAIPLGLTMIMFAWGASLYFQLWHPPENAREIFVTGKQWMWKIQHPEGRREINELHVPTGQAIKLTMTSEDVIHSFFVPAFRIKMDVLPGRYTSTWFKAVKPGEYHLFCAEYCGTSHSRMLGRVIVTTPREYQEWLEGSGGFTGESMASMGEHLFKRLGCVACHGNTASARGPRLIGVFGKQVRLQGGQTVTADENYVRESILRPKAKVVSGYEPIMPTFEGQVSEEQLNQLLAYIKSIGSLPVEKVKQ